MFGFQLSHANCCTLQAKLRSLEVDRKQFIAKEARQEKSQNARKARIFFETLHSKFFTVIFEVQAKDAFLRVCF